MITVIVYGRNDSYGYNLAKRAAISINCIAQILVDPDDEIIFVDCNTPNDIPSFPESIADTLTPKAKQLLRVLRLRPEQYEQGKNGSKFKVLEPLCRNIAIRRSNPANRWILNTNTDMVFTPQDDGQTLTSIVRNLPDGFYELPRFEMPETLWESVDRLDPAKTIAYFKHWGLRLHISQIITASKELLFDGPGDFQLCLRSQLFQMHGMNEQMVLGWHVDSNLCRRMWLLNGETRTVLDRLHAFHCDHTRIQTVYHVAGKSTENSLADFFLNVTTPYVTEQALTWGMPNEVIEEIRVEKNHTFRVPTILEKIVPGMIQPISGSTTVDSFDTGLYYDDFHVFPYLADILVNFSPGIKIGYFGCNVRMLNLLSKLRCLLGHTGQILYCSDLLHLDSTIELCTPAVRDEIHNQSGTFIFDLSMKHLPSRTNNIGLHIPERCQQVVQFAREMSDEIIQVARYESEAARRKVLLRFAIFVGCHSTIFDMTVKNLFSCAMTPVNTLVRSGIVSDNAFSSPPVFPLHLYVIGASIEEITSWISTQIGKPVGFDAVRAANDFFKMFLGAGDNQTALSAIETLLSFDAGRGMLEMQVEISKINGVPEQGEALRNFINEYEKRPYKH